MTFSYTYIYARDIITIKDILKTDNNGGYSTKVRPKCLFFFLPLKVNLS